MPRVGRASNCTQAPARSRRAAPHFVGEAVDVTGWLGGYNFQWAWASGFAAGQAIGAS